MRKTDALFSILQRAFDEHIFEKVDVIDAWKNDFELYTVWYEQFKRILKTGNDIVGLLIYYLRDLPKDINEYIRKEEKARTAVPLSTSTELEIMEDETSRFISKYSRTRIELLLKRSTMEEISNLYTPISFKDYIFERTKTQI